MDRRLFDPQRILWPLTAAAGSALFILGMPPVPDHAYQFFLGSRVLAGARLYHDIAAADMHPPLFTWLAAVIARIAGLGSVTGLDMYHPFVIAMSAIALAGAWRIGPQSNLVSLGVAFAIFPLAGPYFGQGEHLAVLGSLPYLFAAAALVRGESPLSVRGRVAVAIFAAFGMAMKPHFALVWVATELYLATTRGWRSLFRFESVLIASFFVVYVIATFAITPEFFDILPWVAQLYPRYAARPFLSLVFDPRALLLIIAMAAGWTLRRDPALGSLSTLLMSASVAMYAALLLQGKGWGYHWYPVVAFSLVLLCLRIAQSAQRIRALAPLLTAVAILITAAQVNRTVRLLAAPPTSLGRLYTVMQRYDEGSSYAALSQYIHAGFPLTNLTGLDWTLPYAHLWMVPAIHPPGDRRDADVVTTPQWREVEHQIYDRIWSAFAARPPAVLIVEDAGSGGLDMRGFFERDHRFRAFFYRFQPVDTVDIYVVYDTLASHPPTSPTAER